jgi:XTP/dITP diphosphohydrolase
MEYIFVSGNRNKFEEAAAILKPFGIALSTASAEKKVELQDNRLENIVSYALSQIKQKEGKCFIIEDDGIFINALRGFPGPYSAQFYAAIGLEGILKLMQGKSDRSAFFKSAVGVLMPGGEKHIFTGVTRGSISSSIAIGREFGYDPIFIPKGSAVTFAEMSISDKSKISHRGKAFSKLGRFLQKSL